MEVTRHNLSLIVLLYIAEGICQAIAFNTIGPASDHPDTQVLLDDGLLELRVEAVEAPAVICRVVTGGILKSHKGVNLPSLTLRLPSMTEKDRQDLIFGVEQGVDIVSLSFVRQAQDLQDRYSTTPTVDQDQFPGLSTEPLIVQRGAGPVP